MAVPSQSLRSKLALDGLIQSYLQPSSSSQVVDEQSKMAAFESAFFRDVVGTSLVSDADLVTISAYEQLLSWVDASLDMFRPELLELSFLLFVKSYIRMIQKSKGDKAREFWIKFCARFLEDGHGNYMQSLAQLTSIEQLSSQGFLDDHPFVKYALQCKFPLYMASSNLRILRSFIVDHNLLCVLSILNAEFCICDPDKYGEDEQCDNERGFGPITPSEEITFHWSVPGKMTACKKRMRYCEDSCAEHLPSGGVDNISSTNNSDLNLPDAHDDIFFRTLLDNVILPRQVVKNDASTLINDDSVRSVSYNHCELEIKDNAIPPSVMFATFTNTYGDMTCLHLTQDASLAVVGCAGSNNVMVWNWMPQSSSPSNSSFSSVLPLPQSVSDTTVHEEVYDVHDADVPNASNNVCTLTGHSKRVYSVCAEEYSGDNRLVLSGSADETVRLWDVGKTSPFSCLARFSCSDGIPWSVEFGPFGYHFLVGCQYGTAVLHSTDRVSALRVFRGHKSDVTCSSFHPNAAYVATGSDDGTVCLWDIRDSSKQGCIRRLTLAHQAVNGKPHESSGVTSLRCSPCGALVAVGYEDGVSAIWNVSSGSLSYVLIDAANSDSGFSKREQKRRTHTRSSLSSPVYAMRFRGDSTQLATGGQDCAVKLWDLTSNSVQKQDTANRYNVDPYCLLAPYTSYHTKLTPIFSLSGFGSVQNMNSVLFAGGPSFLSPSPLTSEVVRPS